MLVLGTALALGGTAISALSANKQQKRAERKARESQKEMNRLKDIYSQLDTSNPYLDMENTMEDLTINQKQYELGDEMFQQSQSNILETLRPAAGGTGVANLAQKIAQQQQEQRQQVAADIGDEERANEIAARQEEGRLQEMERRGEILSRDMEKQKQGTLMGMSQQELAAYREQGAAAEQAKFDAIGGGVSSIGNMLVGM
tara:strand:- start:372 stop:974 length:603 start_codon:yes stop_codon:yes gene_type:complete